MSFVVKIDPPPQVDKADRELKSQVYYCSESLHISLGLRTHAYHWLSGSRRVWSKFRLAEIQNPVRSDAGSIQGACACPCQRRRVQPSAALDSARLRIRDQGRQLSLRAPCHLRQRFNSVPIPWAAFDTTLEVRNPRLWWPNGLGAQNLYSATFQLLDGAGNFSTRKRAIRHSDHQNHSQPGKPAGLV